MQQGKRNILEELWGGGWGDFLEQSGVHGLLTAKVKPSDDWEHYCF